MAIGARTRAAEFVRRETNALDATRTRALHRPQRASQSLHKHPRTNTRRSGQFRDTQTKASQPQPMRARERSKPASRPRGAQDTPRRDGRLARTTATQQPRSNEAAFSARRRPFPDAKGLPAQPRLHYLATYSARAAQQALPSSSRAVAPQGSRRERRRCDLKPWAST